MHHQPVRPTNSLLGVPFWDFLGPTHKKITQRNFCVHLITSHIVEIAHPSFIRLVSFNSTPGIMLRGMVDVERIRGDGDTGVNF